MTQEKRYSTKISDIRNTQRQITLPGGRILLEVKNNVLDIIVETKEDNTATAGNTKTKTQWEQDNE